MKSINVIGSYAIIGLEYTLDKYSINQKVYLVIDYDPAEDSYKLRPRKEDFDDNLEYVFTKHKWNGFWLKSCFVKILGHPSDSPLIKLLYDRE